MTPKSPRLPYDALRRQHESLTRTLSLLNNSGIEAAMRQMQRQQAELQRIIDGPPGVQLTELSWATQHLYDLSLRTSFPPNAFAHAHATWLSDLRRAPIPSARLEEVVRMALSDISYNLSVTERLLPKFDFAFLGGHLGVQQSTMSQVQRSMSDLWAAYDGLAASLPGIENIVRMPSFVLPGATRELTAHSRALDLLQPGEERSEWEGLELERYALPGDGVDDSGLVGLLERVDPNFASMYLGAVDAQDSDNPDRSRHVLISLRELWNHLFRKLAPKEEVKQWIEVHSIQGTSHR